MKTPIAYRFRPFHRLAALASATLAASVAVASANAPVGGDFDGDATADAAYIDPVSSTLAVGYDIAGLTPDWRVFDLRRYPYALENAFRSADLDNDGRDDLYTANREANRVLVLWGRSDRKDMFEVQEFIVGAGPALAEALPLGNDPGLGVPLIASANPSLYRFRPCAPGDPAEVDSIDPAFAETEWLDFRAGISASGGIDPPLFLTALVEPDGGGPRLHVFQKYPLGALVVADVGLPSDLNRLTELGFFAGASNPPATVAFGIGDYPIAVCTMKPGELGNAPTVGVQLHDVGTVADVRKIVTTDGDQLLVVPAGGGSAGIYDLGGGGFALAQTIDPPAGREFAAIAPAPGGLLLAAFAGGGRFGVYRDSGSGFQLQQEGTIPAPPPPGAGIQILLYGNHPFGAFPALPIEGFPGADWAEGGGFSGGMIHAEVSRFIDSATGLASLGPVALDPSVAIPPGAVAMANQIDADTSASFAGNPGADGGAAVFADPPGGTYAHTVAVRFVSAPGVTVHFRLNKGPWSVATGDIPIARPNTTDLEFMGESASGELSAIRSERYLITQDPDADSDGDKVPDAVEIAAGLSPFAGPDTDGDGINDFSELVAGTDPGDPGDFPADNLALDVQRVRVTVECPTAGGGLAPPAFDTDIGISALDGSPVAAGKTGSLVAPHAEFRIEVGERRPFFVIESAPVHALGGFLALWPQGRRLAAVVELPGKPVPVGPVNLASDDIVGDWLEGVNAAIADAEAQVVEVTLDTNSTLAALAFEAWLGIRLGELGRIAADVGVPQILDEPLPGVRHLVSPEDLEAIASDDGTARRHHLPDVWHALQAAVAEGAAAPLRATLTNIYRTSAGFAPGIDAPPSPLPAMRGILAAGDVPTDYAGSLTEPLGILADLWAQILGSPSATEHVTVSGALETVGVGCLVLIDANDGTRYELVDAGHEAYWQTENAPILSGAIAVLAGFVVDRAPACGDVVVEVASLMVVDVPVAVASDAGANGLPDDFELVLLGGNSGFWDDDDGDGFTNGEELFLNPGNPTDPADPGSFPAGPPALPTGVEATGGGGAHFILEWDGNPAVSYTVETSDALDGVWIPSEVLPIESPPGHFLWEDPDPIVGNARRFYRINATLGPPLP